MTDRTGDGRETAPVPPNRHRPAVEFSTLVPEHLFDDRYRIVRSLGAGGTGEVFLALDELAGGEVALKVLYPPNEPGRMLDRLRRELEIVRSLDHPGIVQIQHLGEAQGLFYFVMELLQGDSLRARIDRGAVAPDQAIAILEALADSLAVAHRSGVVHRDIKPDNIFLATSPKAAGERVVLLDFGIAFREGDARFTATGDLIGTPHYLSPEQARGQTDIGPAADVYALGALTWEMLSGLPLFQGENTMQVIQAHLSQRVPTDPKFPGETPAWFARLVKRMLAKQPADRPRDGAEVLSMIRRKHVPRMTTRGFRLAGILIAATLLIAWAGYALIDTGPGMPIEVRPSGTDGLDEIVGPNGEIVESWHERIAELTGRVPHVEGENLRELTRAAVLDAGAWPDSRLAVGTSTVGPPWDCALRLFDGQTRELQADLRLPLLGPDRSVPTHLSVEDGELLDVDFQPFSLNAAEIDGAPGDEIILTVGSSHSYPSQVLALKEDDGWKTLLEHWNMGNCEATPMDLDGDGTDELVLHGANNAFQEAWITILDPDGGESTAPTQSPPGHRQVRLRELEEYPVGGWTIRFPRVAVSRAIGSPFRFIRGRSMGLDWDPEARRLRVLLRDGTSQPPDNYTNQMAYVFDLRTGSIEVEWIDYDVYLARFQDVYGSEGDPWGVVEQESLRPYEPVIISELLQWNGEGGDQQWRAFDFPGLIDRYRPVLP